MTYKVTMTSKERLFLYKLLNRERRGNRDIGEANLTHLFTILRQLDKKKEKQ